MMKSSSTTIAWVAGALCLYALFCLTLNPVGVNVHPKYMHSDWASRDKGTILVTGGMGNIGKHVVRKLLDSDYKVICLDIQDRSTDLITLLQEENMSVNIFDGPNFHFHKGDIRDVNATVSLLLKKGVELEGIIHLAAVSRVAFCLDNEVDCRDVNIRGTELLLESVRRYLIERNLRKAVRETRYTKPWMIFASSREVYGSKCDVDIPCNEESAPDPLNLYGVTKWEGEKSIHLYGHDVLSNYIILRLASVYGGIFDLPERLIPSLAIKSMTKDTIDLNGGNQIFDFVHIDDVVGSIFLAADRLERGTRHGGQTQLSQDSLKRGKEKFLICSGQHATAFQVLQDLQHLVQSSSPTRLAPSDNRYPSNFVCDNHKMRTHLGINRLVHQDLYQGLAHYVRAIYKKNLRVLERRYTSQCSEKMMVRRLDSRPIQNCSIYVTAVVEGADYLKHLSYPEPTRKRHIGNGVVLRSCPRQMWMRHKDYFLLEYENGTDIGSSKNAYVAFDGEPIYFNADFDRITGGYILRGHILQDTKRNLVLGHGFKVVIEESESQPPTSSLPVSIWPYSCPPDPVTGNARLPTAPYDPTLYLLHEIIPPEPNLSSAGDRPLYCRRIEAGIDLTRQRIQRIRTLIESKRHHVDGIGNTISTASESVSHSPVCDMDCELIGGCVDTGKCRCINPLCGRDSHKNASFPFSSWAFTNITSFGDLSDQIEGIRERIAALAYSTVLKDSAAMVFKDWTPPKIYVMEVNLTELTGKPLDDEATTITQIPYGSCFVADHFHRVGLQGLNTSLEEADFIFVPFYGGWLRHYARWEDPQVASVLNGLLQQAHGIGSSVGRAEGEQPIHIVVPLTHDYGGALSFSYDMRDFRGKSLPQQPLLQNVTVLSPFGDFATLAYLPEKDLVIPPASCKTPLLLETFKDVSFVRRASDRQSLLYFGGSADHRTGSAVRNSFLSGNLFPRSKIDISTAAQDSAIYMQQLNDSIFCPHLFGTTGWATRLSDTIYAGCIPILTSDVTHPPYWDTLDWMKFSVYVDWRHLEDIENTLKSFSSVELERKQAWLLKVRDAFIYDPGAIERESSGLGRKGPIFHTLLSLKAGVLRQKQKRA